MRQEEEERRKSDECEITAAVSLAGVCGGHHFILFSSLSAREGGGETGRLGDREMGGTENRALGAPCRFQTNDSRVRRRKSAEVGFTREKEI